MFMTMLLATFAVALLTALVTDLMFRKPIRSILARIIREAISLAWVRYIRFAIYVVGVSTGVRVWDLEKYITPRKGEGPIVLNPDRWTLEIYRTVIGTLQGVAWLLMVFFVFALIAYVIATLFGARRRRA